MARKTESISTKAKTKEIETKKAEKVEKAKNTIAKSVGARLYVSNPVKQQLYVARSQWF